MPLKFIFGRKLKCIKINFTCLYFSMVTRTFKLTYMAQIVFLLDRASLENAKLEHGLGNPRYVHLGNCAIFMFSL